MRGLGGEEWEVLLAEHDANARHAFRYHLAKAGCAVHDVVTGEQALAYVKAAPVDIVLAEMSLPGMSGPELRRAFFLDPGARPAPFLFLSEPHEANHGGGVLLSGLDEHILKPVDPLALAARVQNILARRQMHEELVRIDPLSQVLNRSAIRKEIAQDLLRLKRYPHPASYCLIDITGFTAVNQSRGYMTGDLIIATLAALISGAVRGPDLVGRYHGAQFVLYMPETPATGAGGLLARLERRFAEATMDILGEPLAFRAGIVEAPHAAGDFPSLHAAAQEALAEAKQHAGPIGVLTAGRVAGRG